MRLPSIPRRAKARSFVLIVAAAAAAGLRAQEAPPPAADLEPGGMTLPQVDVSGLADAEWSHLVEEPEAHPGRAVRITLTNPGDASVDLSAVSLRCTLTVRGLVPNRLLRLLALEGAAGPARVTPFLGGANPTEGSWRLAAAAAPDRRFAVVAGFPGDEAELEARVSFHPEDVDRILVTAECTLRGSLAPGASLVLPEFACLAPFDALDGLDALLRSRRGPAGDGEPFAFDSGTVAWNHVGLPLDLFGSDGHTWAYRPWDGAEDAALLVNAWDEPSMRGVLLQDMGAAEGQACRLIEVGSGRELGTYRGGASLPLPPRTEWLLSAQPTDAAPDGGFEVFVVDPPGPGAAGEVHRFDALDPELWERVPMALDHNGAILANHRGTDVLHPLPAPLANLLIPRFAACAPAEVRLPRGPLEERVGLQASRAAWEIGYPHRDLSRTKAWLACLEAGFHATPLQPVLADGLPAAGGFVVNTSPGVVLVTLDLPEARALDLAHQLADQDARVRLMRAAGQASYAVRVSANPSGAFADLPLPRVRRDDLVPADPYLFERWSAALPGGAVRLIRWLRVEGGEERLPEEVLRIHGSFNFAIDVRPPFEGELIVLLRRAPRPAPQRYTLLIDGFPAADPVVPDPEEDLGTWQDDVVRIPAAMLGGRPRVLISVAPEHGALDLARLALLHHVPKPGVPAGSRPHRAVAGSAPGIDRTPRGELLRAGGRAWLAGLALTAGSAVELDLDGGFASFLARAGLQTGAGSGPLQLVVEVDGVERYRGEALTPRDELAGVTVNVEGARVLVLRALAPDGTRAQGVLDLVEARLLAED